nr:transposase [Photorhabdus bodei]
MLTGWKKTPEYAFLQAAYTDNLQQKLKDLHGAWRRCFDKTLAAKAPVWKRKNDGRDSIRFVNFEKYCLLENRRVRLPSGLGWIKFRQSQEVSGKIKNATISQSAGQWYVSFQVEIEAAEPQHESTTMVGLDAGISKLATLSDGTIYEPVNSFKTRRRKLAKLQRQLSRKVKFSANWQKQKRKIQRLHSRIANIRRDYLHETTTKISKNHAMIVIEDLKASNMSKSAKGTAEQPGRNVGAKTGLNRAILDQGWYEMRRQLEYKQRWRGGQVLAVPPAYTSQRCVCCGHTAKENRLSQSQFVCQVCGYTANADVNGARNILAAGHAVLACGGTEQSGRPLKQEPDAERSAVAH